MEETMKNLFTIALLGGAMALTACGGDKDGESGDTGATTGTATGGTGGTTGAGGTTAMDDMIIAVTADCPDDATYQITVETNFAVGDAIVNVWEVLAEAEGWDEEHAMVAAPVAGAMGDDVVWSLMDEAGDRGGYMNGSETLFACGIHDESEAMVYVARVFDADGVYEDCAAWGGNRIDDVFAAVEGGGDVTSYNGVTDAAQITTDNCITF